MFEKIKCLVGWHSPDNDWAHHAHKNESTCKCSLCNKTITKSALSWIDKWL